jgi:hypothetical protein
MSKLDKLDKTSEGERAWEKADLRQRAELARRLEAVRKTLDALRAEIDLIVIEVERGP